MKRDLHKFFRSNWPILPPRSPRKYEAIIASHFTPFTLKDDTLEVNFQELQIFDEWIKIWKFWTILLFIQFCLIVIDTHNIIY